MQENQVHLSLFNIGSVVRLKGSFLGEPIGTRAVVYERYTIGAELAKKASKLRGRTIQPEYGVSIITENGVDLGGFSMQEQRDYLELIRHTTFEYEFKNVIRLEMDFNKGVFKKVFI